VNLAQRTAWHLSRRRPRLAAASTLLAAAIFLAAAMFGITADAMASASSSSLMVRRRAIQALVLRADADSLATAAALSFRQDTTPSALQLAVNAAELAPQNPIIGWLHLQLCVGTPSCNVRDVATVLRWIDADNGASWLPILAAAYKDRDWTEVDRILFDMAETKRFDLYCNPLVVLLADTLYKARADLPHGFAESDAERLELASAIAGGLVPPFTSLLDSCRSAAAAERREACLKLSRTMQHGDAIAAQMAGFGIEKRLVTPDGKEAHAMNERRRQLDWRVSAAAQADVALPWRKNALARKRLARMRLNPRQEDVDLAILREHKIATDVTEKSRP
jgi:hypothetical protein